MLENIKSSFFIKIIFSFLDEKTKLKLLKYNKSLQNNIDIYLINYRIFKNRYIIYDENGRGSEYNGINEKLIFKGEYLNGERNGKGQEFNSYGKLIYEGEFKNGKKNGKGKEYDLNGKLVFEGEFKNGLRNGNGKEYDFEGYLIFQGEYLNGNQWNGKGHKSEYIVTYELKDGKGFIVDKYFRGEYINGLRNGKKRIWW